MRLARIGLLFLGSMAVSSTGASAEPEVPKDWLRKALETRLTVDGRARWQGFGPGSFVQFRTLSSSRTVTETRETLVATDAGLAIRSDRRSPGEEWTAARETPLRVEPVPNAARSVEALGIETLTVSEARVSCTKERWTRVVDGKPAKISMVVWLRPDGRVAKWEEDFGDGWKTTHEVLRDDVEWRAGSDRLRCREIRRKASTTGNVPLTFEGTELLSGEVPDLIVRQELRSTLANERGQVRELVAFAAK